MCCRISSKLNSIACVTIMASQALLLRGTLPGVVNSCQIISKLNSIACVTIMASRALLPRETLPGVVNSCQNISRHQQFFVPLMASVDGILIPYPHKQTTHQGALKSSLFHQKCSQAFILFQGSSKQPPDPSSHKLTSSLSGSNNNSLGCGSGASCV